MNGSALVLGGSIAGLLAAAALSPHVETVTLVDREDLLEPNRRGVPQGTQVHALLGAGQRAMAALLPGIVDDLVTAGGRLVDSPHEVAIYGAQGWAGRVPSEAHVVFMRRPVLETVVRRRVLALPNVRAVSGVVTGLTGSSDRITGATLQGGSTLAADLIVDATGRNSKAAEWLAEFGCPAPATKELRSYVGYATATVRLPDGVFPPGVVGILSHPHPGALRGSAVVPCDNGLYQVAALGMMKADPPKDREGFQSHLEAAPSRLVAEVAAKAEFVEEPTVYKVRGSLRRMWEDLPAHPPGFLAIGDAVMSFNPLYGQGMSVAASEARILHDEVGRTGVADPGLAGRAQAAFTPVVDTVFHMVVSTDAHYPGAELVGVTAPDPEAVTSGRALSQLATEDPEVALALKTAGHFFDTAPLRSPGIAQKVAAWIADGRTPAAQDPTVIPPALIETPR
ncbi:FAD-dependent monooxygenase [Sporichthya polymorpha]|uniref:FAD-dependent monooxygenase n=1 Tax=Sporichthya polymorpha TaxID=35751 RepID=UPI00036A4682|nr:FAD-dependent monooxygenase [Sporichthya polymorpha]